MPDAHVGIGATVGTVISTVNAIIPAAVGVDIGYNTYMLELQYYFESEVVLWRISFT